ncbi:ribosomal protein L3 [Acrasis kona]|uniref:Ribosomal protein L3 n=1 Tax=Acrasis kona TaxID=1008807 RepID=A0AAW2ZJE4_9EUKA
MTGEVVNKINKKRTMQLVSVVIILCCLLLAVYCGDTSCNSLSGYQSGRSLSFNSPRKTLAITNTRRYFFTGYAPAVGVTLVKTFDGSNGPITTDQFYESQITFAKGKKGCEFCVFDCFSTYIMNQNRGAKSVYNTLFKDCALPYYAYSCIKPNVVKGGNQMTINANTNCKKTSDLSDAQIMGVLDICQSYGKCTFTDTLTKQQILDGFRYKNGMIISNAIYTTDVDTSNGDMAFSIKM